MRRVESVTITPGQAGHDQRETKLKCNKTERDTGRVWTQAEEAAHYAELAGGNILRTVGRNGKIENVDSIK